MDKSKKKKPGRPATGREAEAMIGEKFEVLVCRGMSPAEAAERLATPENIKTKNGKPGLSPDGRYREVETIWGYVNNDRKRATFLEVYQRYPERYKDDEGVQSFLSWHNSLKEARQEIPIMQRALEGVKERKRDERNARRREKYAANKLKNKGK